MMVGEETVAGKWASFILKAQHKSGAVHPYLWDRDTLPPLRAGSTARFIRFCAWLKEDEASAAAAARFLVSSMLTSGAVPFEVTPKMQRPVKECPYLVTDAISTALAGQVLGDEDLIGRALDFIVWSFRQLPGGKFLPMFYNLERPQSRFPGSWMHQPTCHQSVVLQLEMDEFVSGTWGESIVDDFAAISDAAMQARDAQSKLFQADKPKTAVPLLPHFITCESLLKYFSLYEDKENIDLVAESVLQGVELLCGSDAAGDTAQDGQLVGHKRTELVATAIRAGLLVNVLADNRVPFDALSALSDVLSDSLFTVGKFPGMLPVSDDGAWEEDVLVSVDGGMVACQAIRLLSSDELSLDDFLILV